MGVMGWATCEPQRIVSPKNASSLALQLGKRESVMAPWSSKILSESQECNPGSGKLTTPMVKQVQQVECGWMRLNHVECIPLKEHGDRGRHGRCLPSESKQFNSMQPSLGRDPKRQKSKKSFDVLPAVMMHRVGWWEIHGNPALSISVFMWPYHDMWWPSTANLRIVSED